MPPVIAFHRRHLNQTAVNPSRTLAGTTRPRPKTIEAYSRAVRRIGAYFDYRVDELSEQQLTGYFSDLLDTHSWSAVKLDLYGLKFFYAHVLRKPWTHLDLIKPPKVRRLPDIVTVEEVQRLIRVVPASVRDGLTAV